MASTSVRDADGADPPSLGPRRESDMCAHSTAGDVFAALVIEHHTERERGWNGVVRGRSIRKRRTGANHIAARKSSGQGRF